jgi:hypothetical protein
MTKTALLSAAAIVLLSSTAHAMTKPVPTGPNYRPVASGVVRPAPTIVRTNPGIARTAPNLRDAQAARGARAATSINGLPKPGAPTGRLGDLQNPVTVDINGNPASAANRAAAARRWEQMRGRQPVDALALGGFQDRLGNNNRGNPLSPNLARPGGPSPGFETTYIDPKTGFVTTKNVEITDTSTTVRTTTRTADGSPVRSTTETTSPGARQTQEAFPDGSRQTLRQTVTPGGDVTNHLSIIGRNGDVTTVTTVRRSDGTWETRSGGIPGRSGRQYDPDNGPPTHEGKAIAAWFCATNGFGCKGLLNAADLKDAGRRERPAEDQTSSNAGPQIRTTPLGIAGNPNIYSDPADPHVGARTFDQGKLVNPGPPDDL